MNKVGRYFWNIALTLDQTLNTFCGGDPDETVSSRYGKLLRKNSGRFPRWQIWRRFIVWGITRWDPDHFVTTIEDDEGDDAVYSDR